jgi:hypothetical protein
MLFLNARGLLSSLDRYTGSETNISMAEETAGINKSATNTDNSSSGGYEIIEETIARLKKEVVVTGTITGIPGEETAYFKIEGMADRAFLINTQLMDGFIIKEITETRVILKNQIGKETFVLNVQS